MNNISSRYTTLNDSDPFCVFTWVAFCIYGIDPDLVTNKLGIKPTSGQKKGVSSRLPNGNKITGVVNSWILSSKNYVSSKDIRRHLNWVLDKIEPVIEDLKALQNLPDIKMVISGNYLSKEEGGGSIAIWPEQMRIMAEANLEFSIEMLFSGKEDNESGQAKG
jgi:hypothetical protein